MSPEEAETLRACSEALCSDVVFETVAPALIQCGLLNRDELQQAENKDSDGQKVKFVLSILPGKGPDALPKFITVLQKNYSWLAERLSASKPSTTNDCSQNTNNNRIAREQLLNQKISQDMLNMVRKNYRVADKWTSLAHSLELDNQIKPIRARIIMYQEDFDLAIIYLLKEWMAQYPMLANLGNLLRVLRDNTFNDIADELEQKFIL